MEKKYNSKFSINNINIITKTCRYPISEDNKISSITTFLTLSLICIYLLIYTLVLFSFLGVLGIFIGLSITVGIISSTKKSRSITYDVIDDIYLVETFLQYGFKMKDIKLTFKQPTESDFFKSIRFFVPNILYILNLVFNERNNEALNKIEILLDIYEKDILYYDETEVKNTYSKEITFLSKLKWLIMLIEHSVVFLDGDPFNISLQSGNPRNGFESSQLSIHLLITYLEEGYIDEELYSYFTDACEFDIYPDLNIQWLKLVENIINNE